MANDALYQMIMEGMQGTRNLPDELMPQVQPPRSGPSERVKSSVKAKLVNFFGAMADNIEEQQAARQRAAAQLRRELEPGKRQWLPDLVEDFSRGLQGQDAAEALGLAAAGGGVRRERRMQTLNRLADLEREDGQLGLQAGRLMLDAEKFDESQNRVPVQLHNGETVYLREQDAAKYFTKQLGEQGQDRRLDKRLSAQKLLATERNKLVKEIADNRQRITQSLGVARLAQGQAGLGLRAQMVDIARQRLANSQRLADMAQVAQAEAARLRAIGEEQDAMKLETEATELMLSAQGEVDWWDDALGKLGYTTADVQAARSAEEFVRDAQRKRMNVRGKSYVPGSALDPTKKPSGSAPAPSTPTAPSPSGPTVRVQKPDGTTGTIPASQVLKATQRGWKVLGPAGSK